jgi:hypothetical protein
MTGNPAGPFGEQWSNEENLEPDQILTLEFVGFHDGDAGSAEQQAPFPCNIRTPLRVSSEWHAAWDYLDDRSVL